jgi:hypothetical protein
VSVDRESDIAQVSRREFVRLAGMAAAAFALPRCSDDGAGAPGDAGADAGGEVGAPDAPDAFPPGDAGDADAAGDFDGGPDFDLPSLGGAPDTPDGRAIAAFLDTIVPGAHRDPTGAPGALDVGAGALFFDPSLPAAPFVPVLVLALDNRARSDHDGRSFTELTPAERDSTVARLLAATPLLGFAVQLAKLAYFSSRPAADHLGYPGPNPGYVDHEDFTFGRAMATEITPDGNLP